jgi:hypothetical protein
MFRLSIILLICGYIVATYSTQTPNIGHPIVRDLTIQSNPFSNIQQPIFGSPALASSSNLPQASSSNLHQASTSNLHQASTSNLHQASTSNLHQASTSNLHQASSSNLPQASTSNLHQASTSNLHQASNGNLPQASFIKNMKSEQQSPTLYSITEKDIEVVINTGTKIYAAVMVLNTLATKGVKQGAIEAGVFYTRHKVCGTVQQNIALVSNHMFAMFAGISCQMVGSTILNSDIVNNAMSLLSSEAMITVEAEELIALAKISYCQNVNDCIILAERAEMTLVPQIFGMLPNNKKACPAFTIRQNTKLTNTHTIITLCYVPDGDTFRILSTTIGSVGSEYTITGNTLVLNTDVVKQVKTQVFFSRA